MKTYHTSSVGVYYILFANSLVLIVCLVQALINIDHTYQQIRGFGAAIMPPDKTNDAIQNAFGTNDGQIELTISELIILFGSNTFEPNNSNKKNENN